MEKGLFVLIGLSLVIGAVAILFYFINSLNTILAFGILAISLVVFIIFCRKESEK